MKIGFIGLGKMGGQMVQRLGSAGHVVVVYDVDRDAVLAAAQTGSQPATDLADVVRQLPAPAIIWLMIPQQFVAATLEDLLKLLPEGSIVIDGGNSDFRQTITHAKRAQEHGVELVDVGTSGGILGLKNGFSMMVGGHATAYETIKPLLESLAQQAGYGHFGSVGSGHYIKMVHNAIEYGMMEAYAEGFELLKNGHFKELNLSDIAQVWQHGSIIASNLNGLCADILAASPTLEGIDGYVAESGETRWALEVAEEHTIATPAITAALQVRAESSQGKVSFATRLLAAMRNQFGGHSINKS